MRFARGLQVGLQERLRQVYRADHRSYSHEILYLRDFIINAPSLRAIATALMVSEPSVDPAGWADEHFQWDEFALPATEAGRAKVAWWLMNGWADGEVDPTNTAHNISRESNFNAALAVATQVLVDPLIQYFQERLGTESDILYVLERYTRAVRWFDQAGLYEAYQSDTRRGEKLYDRHLRRFLFEQGIDNPFSQPESPTGKADIVTAGRDGGLDLVCEVKLFDGDNKDVAYLAQGVHQAFQYAQDHGRATAYLVIFNLTDQTLRLPDDDGIDWPPRLQVGNVTVYLVTVQAMPLGSASKQGKAKPRHITREQLVAEIHQER